MTKFTRNAIKETFMQLLNEKPLDKISVRDVVESCGISRNTFYYHYHDIYEVLEEILEEERAKPWEISANGIPLKRESVGRHILRFKTGGQSTIFITL